MVEYVFGTSTLLGGMYETLRTMSDEHTCLQGIVELERDFDDTVIVDRFRIVRKIRSAVNSEGKCYDWYMIDGHYRNVDSTKLMKERQAQDRADIDYIAMETGVEL